MGAHVRQQEGEAARGRWGWARTLGFYATGALALLQTLDVLVDRVGLPDRVFLRVAVGTLLLLPAAVAVSVLRGFAEEEDAAPARPARPPHPAATVDAPHPATIALSSPPPAPPPPADSSAEPDAALVHYRLARLCERSGDDAGARHHYLRFLELRGDARGPGSGDG